MFRLALFLLFVIVGGVYCTEELQFSTTEKDETADISQVMDRPEPKNELEMETTESTPTSVTVKPMSLPKLRFRLRLIPRNPLRSHKRHRYLILKNRFGRIRILRFPMLSTRPIGARTLRIRITVHNHYHGFGDRSRVLRFFLVLGYATECLFYFTAFFLVLCCLMKCFMLKRRARRTPRRRPIVLIEMNKADPADPPQPPASVAIPILED